MNEGTKNELTPIFLLLVRDSFRDRQTDKESEPKETERDESKNSNGREKCEKLFFIIKR